MLLDHSYILRSGVSVFPLQPHVELANPSWCIDFRPGASAICSQVVPPGKFIRFSD